MATAINIATVVGGASSGTPLTSAAIAIGAGVEEVITFSNWPGNTSMVLDTDGTDVTYGYATGHTGGKINSGVSCPIETGGRTLYVNSAAGANLWIRVL